MNNKAKFEVFGLRFEAEGYIGVVLAGILFAFAVTALGLSAYFGLDIFRPR